MTSSNAFALKESGLNDFLFAEVGTELNGSPLTILSILARLGQDPWAEAARWAKLPKAATIDKLAQSIAQMPLPPQAIAEARTTASRLILLLPSQAQSPRAEPKAAKAAKPAASKWVLVGIFGAALVLGVTFSLLSSTPRSDGVVPLSAIDAPHSPGK
nr:hypothetical protein [uncultured Rhodopila sp.]